MKKSKTRRLFCLLVILTMLFAATGIVHAATLGKPSGLAGTIIKGTDDVKISWKKVPNCSGYKTTVIKSNGTKASDYGTATYCTIKDREGEAPIKVYVQAYKGKKSNLGPKSSTVTVVIPKKQTAKVTSAANGTAKISWTKDKNVTGYQIWRATSKNGKYTKVKTVKGAGYTSWTNTKLTNCKTYYYKVRGYKACGSGILYGKYSSVKSTCIPPKQISITATYQSGDKAKISWKKQSNVTGYQIWRATSKNGTYKKVKTVQGAGYTSWTDTSLTTGQTYYYKARAYKNDTSGKAVFGAYSTVKSVSTAPKQVSGVAVSYQSGDAKISWSKQSYATGYQIYRATSKSGEYKKMMTVKSPSTTSWTDTDLSAAQTYYYKVRAYKVSGDNTLYGAFSTVKSVSTAPKQVTGVAVSYQSGDAKISWSKQSYATGYQIYRATSKSGEYKKMMTVKSPSTTSWTDTDLSAAQTYYYKVRAYKASGDNTLYGTFSSVKSVSTAPKQVTGVSVTPQGNDSAKISWSKQSYATGYQIYRATSKSGEYKKVKTVENASTISWTDTGLSAGQTYYYKVRTYKASGDNTLYGKYSEIAGIKIIEEDPGLITEAEYLAKYTDENRYNAVPYYRYATRKKEYKQSGYSSLSSDNGNPWTIYDKSTSSTTSGYYFANSYPSGSTSYTSTSKVAKSITSKGKYYYGYSLKRNSDKAYYIDSSRAKVITWAQKNYSSSSVWAESNLYYLWYVGGENSTTETTKKKTVNAHTDSTLKPGTSSCMKSDTTATLGGSQHLYYWSKCYKVKTTTTTNYFERWSSWSSWGSWGPKQSTSDYKKEDTTKMYYVTVQ